MSLYERLKNRYVTSKRRPNGELSNMSVSRGISEMVPRQYNVSYVCNIVRDSSCIDFITAAQTAVSTDSFSC
jgi:hypothetical protein